MDQLNSYFARQYLNKIRHELPAARQGSVDVLLEHMHEDGRINFNALRAALSPLASSTNSANTMLKRFLDQIQEVAKEKGLNFRICVTPNKKAGDDRWVWLKGPVDTGANPYTGDLQGVPEERLEEGPRGLLVRGAPIVLFTVNDNEYKALRELFPSAQERHEKGYCYAELGVVSGQPVIHVLSGQHRKNAQQAANWAWEKFSPQALIGVGIAFGIRDDKRQIGDVLVSAYLFDYSEARINKDGSETPRGARPKASSALLRQAKALKQSHQDDSSWPRIHIGPLLCGDMLVDNPSFIEKLLTNEPEAIGGDQESAGIEQVAHENNIGWIIVKGISDWGDGSKNTPNKKDHQFIAAKNAARVVRAMLEAGPLRIQTSYSEFHLPITPPDVRQMREETPGLDKLIIEQAQACPIKLNDTLQPEKVQQAVGQPVLPYLHQWLNNPEAPALFALLGEYGMGKTITCQLFARQLNEARQQDPTQPMPLYFDLRHITSLRERVPSLGEALEECMKSDWLDQGGYTLENVHAWIAQGAVVIFDGLDEVLVKLSEADGQAFTQRLLKLLADSRARAGQAGQLCTLKILISCRTQYFPSLQAQNSHFTGQGRGEFAANDYQAMLLLPWGEDQVRRYLQRALPEMDIERLSGLLRSVHNLQELSQRPYTLKLISEFIPEIEQARAAGQAVYGVTLYRKMAEKWLARDAGKHHIRPEHKMQLATHLAAHLWRTGRHALPVGELNNWFHTWLDSHPALRSRYSRLHPEHLEEDLRTATFLARQDGENSGFRFAHTSLLEFFLAQSLYQAIQEDQLENWSMPLPSQETLDFLGQMLAEQSSSLLQRLATWSQTYHPQSSELMLVYALRAKAQGWPSPSLRKINLSGARLAQRRPWNIEGQPGKLLDLSHSQWNQADLSDCVFRYVDLSHAQFDGAQLARSNFLDCRMDHARLNESRLDGSIFRGCRLEHSQWQEARGYRTQFLHCEVPQNWPAQSGAHFERLIHDGHTLNAEARLTWFGGGRPKYVRLPLPLAFAPNIDAMGRKWLINGGSVIRLWDVASGEAGPVLQGHEGDVFSCAFAPQLDKKGQQWLASAGKDGTVLLWNLATGEARPVLQEPKGMFSCAFASQPDREGQQWLASAGADGRVLLWNVTTEEDGPVLRGHKNAVWSCAFAPQLDKEGQQWLASAGVDGTVRLWNLTTKEDGPVLRGHESDVWSCTFAPQLNKEGQQWLASAGEDGTVRLWNVATGEAGAVLQGHKGGVWSCAFAPHLDDEGYQWLASTGVDGLRLWNLTTGEAGDVLQDTILSCAFAPHLDSGHQWLAGAGFGVHLWSLTGEVGPVLQGHTSAVSSCAFAQAGKEDQQWLVSAGWDGRVCLWNLVTGEAGPVFQGHKGSVLGCAFAPQADKQGQQWLASAGADSRVRLWNLVTGEIGPVLQGHEGGGVLSCAFAPQLDKQGQQWLASTGADGTVRLWNLTTGAVGPVLQGHVGGVLSCAFAQVDQQGQQWLASAGADGTVRLWNLTTEKAGPTLPGKIFCAFAPQPDRQLLAVAGEDGRVRLWNLTTGETGPVLQGHKGTVHSCAFAPQLDKQGQQWLASAGEDGTVRLWNLTTGAAGLVLQGHEGLVMSCTFAPQLDSQDRQLLASTGNDGTLRLWDVATGECLRITAFCTADGLGRKSGFATWEPPTQRVIACEGDAWRYLAYLNPVANALPERLPIDLFMPK